MNNIKELTLRGMILGAVITLIFTASNVYLGLKVRLTFSSAIPAAVISMAILRFYSDSTILENNMVQTQASAAGTLSAVIFVLPGLIMLGYWQHFPFWQTMLICASGGMLGVVFSIPLRHVMVVKSNLPYPEGVAAAEILKAGSREYAEKNTAQGNSGLKDILLGAGLASLVSLATNGLRLLSSGTAYWFKAGSAIFQLPMGFSLALLSAGYLVGITSGIAILIGAFIAWGVAVPIISSGMSIGESVTISDIGMSIWATKVRYIGAGTLAIAAIWTLGTLFKPMLEGIKLSFRTISGTDEATSVDRTETDMSPRSIGIVSLLMGIILIGVFYAFIAGSATTLSMSAIICLVIASVIFAFIMGFLVAAACGYMAGLVGSSASPISGIGIIAVTAVSLLLLVIGELNGMLGTEEGTFFATALALFVTSAVVAMAAISNDNLQDLKTGYLLKATPWRQQVALLIGCVVGAIVIAPVLGILHEAYGFSGAMPREGMDVTQALSAPQATLMTTIAKGIFSHHMDWTMLGIGILVGSTIIAIELVLKKMASPIRIPALAVGMGIYLPASITLPLVVGAILSWFIKKEVQKRARAKNLDQSSAEKASEQKATLIASGLIVGESLVGVLMAIIIVISLNTTGSDAPLSMAGALSHLMGNKAFALFSELIGLLVFIIICSLFYRQAIKVTEK